MMEEDKPAPARKDGKRTEEANFLREALDNYKRGYERDRENIRRAQEDLQFRAGEQEDQWDRSALVVREGRPTLTVNMIPKYVRTVTGDIRNMRPAVKILPADQKGDEAKAKIYEGLIRYVEGRSEAKIAYTEAADSQVSCGVGHWMVDTEYADATTFTTEIRIKSVEDQIAVVWDPDSVLKTREDAAWCFVPHDMSRAAYKKRYPHSLDEDFSEMRAHDAYQTWVADDYIRVADYWCKEPVSKRLAQMPDGSIEDVTGDEAKEAEAVAAGAKVRDREAVKVKRYRISAGSILEEHEWPGSYIPVVPVLGEEVKMGRKVYRHGVVRYLKDAQRRYNYFISAQTEALALAPKAPWIGTEKQFQNYMDVWETANTLNHPYLPYTPDPQAGGPPQRVPPPSTSPGFAEAMAMAIEDMKGVTGIYDASLGVRSNETSGKAIMARQREGDVGTFVYVDNFALALRHTGRILVDLIPHIYDSERTIRIMGEDGAVDILEINKGKGVAIDGIPEMIENDVTSGSYDVVLEMGPSYSTKREEAREGMIALIQANPQIGPVMMDLIAKAQEWPMADKIAARFRAMLPPEIKMLEDLEEQGMTPEQAMQAMRQQQEQQANQPPPIPPAEQVKLQTAQIKGDAEAAKAQASIQVSQNAIQKSQMDMEKAIADFQMEMQRNAHDIAKLRMEMMNALAAPQVQANRESGVTA